MLGEQYKMATCLANGGSKIDTVSMSMPPLHPHVAIPLQLGLILHVFDAVQVRMAADSWYPGWQASVHVPVGAGVGSSSHVAVTAFMLGGLIGPQIARRVGRSL